VYKLAVMVEAYRQAAAGGLSLDGAAVTIDDEDMLDDGVETDSGTTLSVREALERMITVSDNSCARALLRLLDTRQVNATAQALGLTNTRINTTLPDAERSADENTTSARDMERLFAGLLRGTVVSPAASAEMLAVLGRQQINDRLPSGLPDGTPIAHKTGNLDGVAHDVGVVTTPFGPRIVVLLTDGFADYADVVALAGAIAHDAYSLPLERFAAGIAPQQISKVVPGQPYVVLVRVTNDSTFAWDATFHLASHWRNESGAYVQWDGYRAALRPLAPGQTATVEFHGFAPLDREPLAVLELDVVHEGVAWAGTPARMVVAFGAP
jgi:beta-lactamase class A